MKKAVSLVLTGAILTSTAFTAVAGDVIEVYLDNNKIIFDTDPEIVSDRTFVPLRAIVEDFGAKVDWNGEERSVTITKNGAVNYLRIGDVQVSTTKDGNTETSEIEAAPYIKDDRTMVPLRYISEGFGMKVDWDGETRTVYITSYDINTDNLVYYNGFSSIPDFGVYEGIAAAEGSNDEMYFYENVTDGQKADYLALLATLGFKKVDEMSAEGIESEGYEKDNEQLVVATFNGVFGVTPVHKHAAYTSEVKYYSDYPTVPDYGVINGKQAVGTNKNSDASTTYEYKSNSASDRTNELLTYLDVLEAQGFAQTEVTISTMTLTKGGNTIVIDQGTEDTVTVKITVK